MTKERGIPKSTRGKFKIIKFQRRARSIWVNVSQKWNGIQNRFLISNFDELLEVKILYSRSNLRYIVQLQTHPTVVAAGYDSRFEHCYSIIILSVYTGIKPKEVVGLVLQEVQRILGHNKDIDVNDGVKIWND